MCARDGALLEDTCQKIANVAPRSQTVIGRTADVSREKDVAELVNVAFATFPRVHILVNNAGVYGPFGEIEAVDWAAWVRAIEINLLGSVLMCRALMPHFKSHTYGKILQLSGGGATKPLPRISAYAASKAAVTRFVETLAEEVREDRIDVNSIAPGALNTRLLDAVIAAGPHSVGQSFYDQSLKQKNNGGASLEQAAGLAVFLASAASDGISGKLLSAVWDPWQSLNEHRTDLDETDVYTLRRIVPQDRNLRWGEK